MQEVAGILQQVQDAEARFVASCGEWDRRALVQAGQQSMHRGTHSLFRSYNGKRQHAGQYVALPAGDAGASVHSGSGRERTES